MKKVMESELGEPIEGLPGVRDRADRGRLDRPGLPRAAADDRDVAVQVQYPGVAQAKVAGRHAEPGDDPAADEADRAGSTSRPPRRSAPGSVTKLDLQLEAQNQRTLSRIFRGHPFIRVPEVVSSLSREKVLVREYVTGLGFDAIEARRDARPHRRDHLRFFFGCMYRHRQFSGDRTRATSCSSPTAASRSSTSGCSRSCPPS